MSKFFISCKESRIETNRSFYSSFIIGPFHTSESLTLANSVRRSLLSELSGIAIISVQIEGAAHEYSNLPGIRDSVLDILLNVREIVLKKVSKTIRSQIGYLRARGPGIIKAGDLCLPPFIKCVDPKQYITTLTEDGVLNMKFIIAEGNNYIKGKPKMVIDFYQFKKRRLILKKLNQTCQNSLILKNSYIYLKKKLNKTFADEKLTRAKLFLQLNPIDSTLIKNNENQNSGTVEKNNIHSIKKNSLTLSPLNVDAVFNPITNVNCITEANEHKILEDLFNKSNKIENDLTILKTKPLLQPYLEQRIKTNSSINFAINLIKTSILKDFNSATNSKSIQTWSHEIKKDNIFHNNVIIEVWTNGSLHPRKAISEAFKYLIKLFSKLKQIKLTQPLVKLTARNINLIREFKNNSDNLLPLNQQSFQGKYRELKEYQLKETENFLEKNKLNLNTKNIISKKQLKSNLKIKKTKILLEKKEKNNLNTKNITKKLKNNFKINNIKNIKLLNLNKSTSTNIEILQISLRALMALKKENINTIQDLLELTKKDLFNIPNIGKKSIEEIEKSLLKIGLNLKIR